MHLCCVHLSDVLLLEVNRSFHSIISKYCKVMEFMKSKTVWSSSRSQCCSCVTSMNRFICFLLLLELMPTTLKNRMNIVIIPDTNLLRRWCSKMRECHHHIHMPRQEREKKETNMILFTINNLWTASTRNISSLAPRSLRSSRNGCDNIDRDGIKVELIEESLIHNNTPFQLAPEKRVFHEITHLGFRIDFNTSHRRIQSRNFRDVIVFAFTFFFLEFERDTTNRSFLDTLHQMCCETCDFVSKTFGRDNGLKTKVDGWFQLSEKLTDHFIDDTFVGVKIESETGVTVCPVWLGWNTNSERQRTIFRWGRAKLSL